METAQVIGSSQLELNSILSGLLTTVTAGPPVYWYLAAAALAFLVPTGFVLISVAGLDAERAWNAALGGLAAIGLAALGYWAVGFAFQFGGVGLVYPHDELRNLVWEWSPFSTDWGVGWGVAGLSGWFLSGTGITPLAYALFIGHLPWAMTTALLPVVALRGRAPASATMVLGLLLGAIIYPLADNWVRGGGWLSALGSNLNLGHGFVDFGGAGTVHLVAAGFSLAALVVWIPRRPDLPPGQIPLPPVQLPLLSVVGSLLIFAGALGWLWTNPLQVSVLSDTAVLRGSANAMLYAAGGVIIPLIYTWFVTGRSEPMMTARGLAAGVVAGLAAGPFVQPGVAFFIGLLAGGTVPFVTFLIDGLLRLDDATGSVSISALPAMMGLVMVGIFADGSAGAGWQMVGVESHLGVAGQGVSGLFTLPGYQADFPGQVQAQVIGILALFLWGFLTGIIICAPLGMILYSLLGERQVGRLRPNPLGPPESLQGDLTGNPRQGRRLGRGAGSPPRPDAPLARPNAPQTASPPAPGQEPPRRVERPERRRAEPGAPSNE
jgi:ammonium transporter, Amt family